MSRTCLFIFLFLVSTRVIAILLTVVSNAPNAKHTICEGCKRQVGQRYWMLFSALNGYIRGLAASRLKGHSHFVVARNLSQMVVVGRAFMLSEVSSVSRSVQTQTIGVFRTTAVPLEAHR